MGFLTAAAGTFSVGDTLYKLAVESGFAGLVVDGGWRNLVMIVIACVLLYLGIVKGFEPLLLVGIRIHEYLDVHHIAQTPIDQRHYSLDDDDWLWLHMNGLWQTVADKIGISRLFDSLSCTQFAYLLDEEFPVEGIRMVEIDCLALFVCQIGGVIII